MEKGRNPVHWFQKKVLRRKPRSDRTGLLESPETEEAVEAIEQFEPIPAAESGVEEQAFENIQWPVVPTESGENIEWPSVPIHEPGTTPRKASSLATQGWITFDHPTDEVRVPTTYWPEVVNGEPIGESFTEDEKADIISITEAPVTVAEGTPTLKKGWATFDITEEAPRAVSENWLVAEEIQQEPMASTAAESVAYESNDRRRLNVFHNVAQSIRNRYRRTRQRTSKDESRTRRIQNRIANLLTRIRHISSRFRRRRYQIAGAQRC